MMEAKTVRVQTWSDISIMAVHVSSGVRKKIASHVAACSETSHRYSQHCIHRVVKEFELNVGSVCMKNPSI